MRRAHNVCEGICYRTIINFLYYCKYGILIFGDDEIGPADGSKRTKRVHGWPRRITRGRLLLFAILLHREITTLFV